MNLLAFLIYLLVIIGALASTSRNAPMGLREWAVAVSWPLAVAVATISGLFTFIWAGICP